MPSHAMCARQLKARSAAPLSECRHDIICPTRTQATGRFPDRCALQCNQALPENHNDRNQCAHMHHQIKQDHDRAFRWRHAGELRTHDMLRRDRVHRRTDLNKHEHTLNKAKSDRLGECRAMRLSSEFSSCHPCGLATRQPGNEPSGQVIDWATGAVAGPSDSDYLSASADSADQ